MSEVTATAFRDSLFTAFDTYWADRTLISYPNGAFDPDNVPDGQGWVALYVLGGIEPGETRYSNSTANSHFSREGIFTVNVFARQGTYTDTAYSLAEDVTKFMQNPGVAATTFSNISSPIEIGPDGVWFQVSVSANWVYFTDRAV